MLFFWREHSDVMQQNYDKFESQNIKKKSGSYQNINYNNDIIFRQLPSNVIICCHLHVWFTRAGCYLNFRNFIDGHLKIKKLNQNTSKDNGIPSGACEQLSQVLQQHFLLKLQNFTSEGEI